MGQDNCCVRDKRLKTQDSSSLNTQQSPSGRFSQQQFHFIEKLSRFNPRKNAMPVALTHFMQDGCQGLMKSLPRLIEVSSFYGVKGDSSHYFDPIGLKTTYGLTECVSPGRQYKLSELSDAFQAELKYFTTNGTINEESPSWNIILIFKVQKSTHCFTIKKRNGWEYVLHTLYEVTEEEIKEEAEQYKKSPRKSKHPESLQTTSACSQQIQQPQDHGKNSIQKAQLLYSEESTIQDEYPQLNNTIEEADTSQINQKVTPTLSTPFEQGEIIPRQSTRATYRQTTQKQLRLRDMVFKGYNCGEICFSPYNVFLEYLNCLAEEYSETATQTESKKGFMQLITFQQDPIFAGDSSKDYRDIFSEK